MNVILAATDFSHRSDRAVRRAAMLAAANGARLDLVHVVDDDQPERLVVAEREAAQAILDETLRDWPELRGIEGRALVALGEPFDAIVRSVQESAADLVVLGAHRRALLRDIFTGTTAERVMRTGHAPVLMVNTEPAGPYRKSLAGLDLSEHSRRALAKANDLGLLAGTRLSAVHAYDVPERGAMSYANIDPLTIARHAGEAAQQARQQVAALLADLGLGDATVRLKEGEPAAALIEAADELRPDLVVIGTRGRGGLARLLLGSVAQALLARLEHDTLVVPPPAS